ncbi:MAG TPA: FAD-dependent thymidylate synthase [Actinocrinis sp.]|nr:FAD-dependent thymidylate synthase [Actinocrinis sp.]HXR69458.1 FAD-dependent thymidylate synthase [Actinocrinis sp.]
MTDPQETPAGLTEVRFRSDVTVELVKSSAADADVLFAARVSTAGEQSLAEVGSDAERSAGLINYLMRDRHGSPFEHNSFTFFVSAPIFVFREFMRHRAGFCLAGDTVIALENNSGLRYTTIADLYRRWHVGVDDQMSESRGGVTWNERAARWQAQAGYQGKNHHLGLFENRVEAETAVATFRSENPPTRRRLLASAKRNQVRCFNEETLRPQRARILDVIESGAKPLLRLETETGLVLRCSKDHSIFTPDGWRKAGELAAGDCVFGAGFAGVPSQATVPPSLRSGIGVWTSMQRNRLIGPVDRCYRCGDLFDRDELVLDHVVPVAEDLKRALDLDNLAPCCADCHRQKTNLEQALANRGGKTAAAVPHRLVLVEDDGVEMTYDLSVEGPWHNFLANGIVVHNSYNEESGRYRRLEPVFYLPGADRKLVQQGKPGRYVFVDGTAEQQKLVDEATRAVCTGAYRAYLEMLEAGVAREVARGVLPVSIYSSMYATCNARALMHFLSLRTKREDSAFPSFPQREIEMVAERMEEVFAEAMPLTYAAFNRNGRVAP